MLVQGRICTPLGRARIMTPRIGFCWISRAEMPSSFEADERKDKGSEKTIALVCVFWGPKADRAQL